MCDSPVVPLSGNAGQIFGSGLNRSRVPQADLNGVAVGRQRLGVNLVSLITALREEGRLPVREIHDLGSLYPKDQKLARWAADVHRLWELAKDTSPILRQSNARQSNARQSNAGWLKMGLSRRCWPDANRSWRTHRRSKTNSAGASKSTLRNCSFLWPRLKRHRTTTPPKGASAIW